ncbi:VIT domain-containing protein [Paraliomyxa miuraensis]|uniref:VIT domain-containing protein n=1 Tax=Paraliomyxa miuraensis TaxID=376150 RepID=UPI002251A8FB|nr:VIT domain-containing protein [Paraliomyxa miuraensis]MCX4246842.1 VIT domain-containing protein [Paraliomyxa miuraensis]
MPKPAHDHPRARARILLQSSSLCLLMALGCRSGDAAPEGEPAAQTPQDGASEAAAPAPAEDVAEVVAISGPGGLLSPTLPPGTFLGKGGRLQEEQALETPRGTLAELRLPGGIRVRMNEDTALTLPGSGAAARMVLTRGEVVVLTEPGATAELSVAAGDEVLTVTRGEAQIRNAGTTRHFAVLSGTASLQAPSRSLTLAPGESIDAPLPEERERRPELSLAPLQETGWSRTFENAARMADEVPAGVGSLTARRAGSRTEQQRLRLTDETVTVNIAGRIAHTEVEQAFFNDQPAVLEGIYRFPLPGDGSVSGLSLLVGNRWMEGEIVEQARARRIFAAIVDATIPRDPALLEWERGNIFKLRVFPIPGRGERRVRLAYTQVLPVAGDTLRYRFPLAGSGAGGTEIERFKFEVTVDGQQIAEAQLADIETPMMELDRHFEDGRVRLVAERERFIPTADLGIDIPVGEQEARVHTETHLDRDGQAYFMVSMRPQLELPRPEGATSYAFVLDRSHSTSPELWTVARGMVEALSSSMEPDDRFAVLACDTACDQAPGGLLSPQPGDLDEVQRFLERQDLAGASDVGGMLVSAAEALERSGAPGERVIVYLGDGTPSSGELAADRLARHVAEPLRGTRVMAVALGARSDLTTLEAVVQQTGGDILRADPRDDRQQLVRELRLRARVPMATDVELDVPDGMVAVHRHGTAGLRPGDTLVLVGKLSRPVHDEVVVRARGPEGPVEARFRVDLEADRSSPVEHRHLPRTWAQAEIAHLTQTKGAEARDEIIALSQHYTVMSRHTSLLVLENDAMFREFNVVRAAKNTDKWDGKLTEAPSSTAENEQTETATTKSDEKAKGPSSASGATATPAPADDFGAALEKREEADRTRGSASAEPFAEPEPDPAPPPAGGVPGGIPGGVAGGVVGGKLGGAAGSGRGQAAKDDGDFGLGFDSPAEPTVPPAETEIDADEDDDRLADVDLGDDEGGDGFGSGLGKSSGSSSRPSADDILDPAKSSTKKKKKARPMPSSPAPGRPPQWDDDPLSGGGGWSSPPPGWGAPKGGGHWRPIRRLKTRPIASPDPGALAKLEPLRLAVDIDPTQRSTHGKLVRAALRAGHPDALAFARAWAEVDPDHAAALTALADAMAADGDPMALRAYESALEVQPFAKRQHTELAQAYESKGDLRRACSHRRALVSIDPRDGDHHADLVRCLALEGRSRDAVDALDEGRRLATKDTAGLGRVGAAMSSRTVTPATIDLHRGAELKLDLIWTGEGELDLAVVDVKGRRLSGMRPEGKARVRESSGREELTLRKVSKSVFVEVTRPSSSRTLEGERGVLHGVLTVKTPDGTRKIPVTMREGSVRVAKVFWSTR